MDQSPPKSNAPDQTRTLIQQVQQGSPSALHELCARYLARVLAAVRIQLGQGLRRKLESGDIVQEVMIDAVRHLPTFEFKTEGAFLHYINRVVANKIRDEADRWTTQKRDLDREVPVIGSSSGAAPFGGKLRHTHPEYRVPGACYLSHADTATPSQIFANREDLQLLEQALDHLTEESIEYRDLVVAVKLEGRSYEEIAEETGKSIDAVRMQVSRAMKALTKIFERLEAGDSKRRE